jgi:glycerate kinase
MDFHKLLEVAAGVAKLAGANGVPVVGLAGTVALGVDQLINDVSAQTGLTREEIAANTGIAGAQDLIELLADQAKGE